MANAQDVSLDEFLAHAVSNGNVLSFDCETTGKNAFTCKPLMYTLAAGKPGGIKVLVLFPNEMAHAWLKELFHNTTLKVVMHNSSYDCTVIHRFICPFREIRVRIIDSIVLAWLDDNRGAKKYGKPFGLKPLAKHYLGVDMVQLNYLFKTGPEALARKELERKAKKLRKHWLPLAKRHALRQKRFLKLQISYAKQLVAESPELDKNQKVQAKRDLDARYAAFTYDFDRAQKAVNRLLNIYKIHHQKINDTLWAKFIAYAKDDADITLRLYWHLRNRLTKKGLDGWAMVELDVRMLATDMEITGVLTDLKVLQDLDKHFDSEIDRATKTCYAELGKAAGLKTPVPFNINATKEVSFALHTICKAFPDLTKVELTEAADSIKAREKDPESKPWFSTDKEVLTYTEHPLAAAVLEQRMLAKLKSTYVKKMAKVHGRTHTHFRSSGTDTGRFASSGPNLQNIPSRTDLGRRIRQAFIARPGFKLLDADLSQIELRVGAILCNEANLLEVYAQHRIRDDGTCDYTVGDVHATTQNKLSALCPFEVEREHAKVANFSLMYGAAPKSFAIRYQLSFELAQGIHSAFFDSYPNIYSTIEELGELWKVGHCRSWRIPFSGRHRHWDRYYFRTDSEGVTRRFQVGVSKGNLLNTLVQGSAADVLKMGVRAFWKFVVLNPKYKDKVFPLLQVHDELVVEAADDVAIEVAKLLRYCLEYPWFETPIPVLADIRIVNNWAEGKKGYREKIGPDGKVVMQEKKGKDGKVSMVPTMEAVYPELNNQIKYLKPEDIEWCKTFVPDAPPIEVHRSYVLNAEELALAA